MKRALSEAGPSAYDSEGHGPEDEDTEAGAEARQSRVRDALVRQAHIDALFTVCAMMYRLSRDSTASASMFLDSAAVAVTLSAFFLSREKYVNGVYSHVAARSITLIAVRLHHAEMLQLGSDSHAPLGM